MAWSAPKYANRGQKQTEVLEWLIEGHSDGAMVVHRDDVVVQAPENTVEDLIQNTTVPPGEPNPAMKKMFAPNPERRHTRGRRGRGHMSNPAEDKRARLGAAGEAVQKAVRDRAKERGEANALRRKNRRIAAFRKSMGHDPVVSNDPVEVALKDRPVDKLESMRKRLKRDMRKASKTAKKYKIVTDAQEEARLAAVRLRRAAPAAVVLAPTDAQVAAASTGRVSTSVPTTWLATAPVKQDPKKTRKITRGCGAGRCSAAPRKARHELEEEPEDEMIDMDPARLRAVMAKAHNRASHSLHGNIFTFLVCACLFCLAAGATTELHCDQYGAASHPDRSASIAMGVESARSLAYCIRQAKQVGDRAMCALVVCDGARCQELRVGVSRNMLTSWSGDTSERSIVEDYSHVMGVRVIPPYEASEKFHTLTNGETWVLRPDRLFDTPVPPPAAGTIEDAEGESSGEFSWSFSSSAGRTRTRPTPSASVSMFLGVDRYRAYAPARTRAVLSGVQSLVTRHGQTPVGGCHVMSDMLEIYDHGDHKSAVLFFDGETVRSVMVGDPPAVRAVTWVGLVVRGRSPTAYSAWSERQLDVQAVRMLSGFTTLPGPQVSCWADTGIVVKDLAGDRAAVSQGSGSQWNFRCIWDTLCQFAVRCMSVLRAFVTRSWCDLVKRKVPGLDHVRAAYRQLLAFNRRIRVAWNYVVGGSGDITSAPSSKSTDGKYAPSRVRDRAERQ